MDPIEVGKSYDSITHRWQSPEQPLDGLEQHERAIQFVKNRGYALDAGCGCNGRFIDLLRTTGFTVEGADVSERMIAFARQRDPTVQFYHVDICEWELPRKYDFITGWDSIWHVPLAMQNLVLQKLCAALNPGGVLIFTTGAVDGPGDVRDAHMGVPMYTAALGIPKTLEVLAASGCACRHLEYDQFPQLHLYVIAQKT
jgi:2-polyprenyl-3-methyl-5-hydroxy-6-metoxy-1,4-benzoquinol methylase